MGSSGNRDESEAGDETRRPFRYRKTFGVGRESAQSQVESAMGGDPHVVSAFIEELLRTSEAGREFAKNSLSIKNATRRKDEEISTQV